jgi:hypothetical protein
LSEIKKKIAYKEFYYDFGSVWLGEPSLGPGKELFKGSPLGILNEMLQF